MSRALNQPVQGLRGLSIILVFLSHWYAGLRSAGLYPPAFDALHLPLLNVGRYGVEIFFMISGFVILGSLRRHATVTAFLIDRIARIYPLFFALHVLVFTAGTLFGHRFFSGVGLGEWIYLFAVNLLLLPGVFDLPIAQIVAWSLSYEVCFYVLAAAAMGLLRRSAVKGRLVEWLGWGAAAGAVLYHHPRMLFFLPGVAAALYGPQLARLVRWMPAYFPLLWLGAYLALWPALDPAQGQTWGVLVASDVWRALTVTGGFLAGALFFWQIAVLPESPAARVFAVTPVVRLGDISYSFYLWHLFVIVGLRPIFRRFVAPVTGEGLSFWLFGVVAFAGAVIVSRWSRTYLEVQAGEKMRDWLRARFGRRAH